MKLTHPASDQVIEVSGAQVPMYASQGWRPVVEVPKPAKKAAPRPKKK